MTNLVADRLRVNKLVLKIASWVASAMLRRVELWDGNLVILPALAARAAVLAFGNELLDLKLPNESGADWILRLLDGHGTQWLSRGGRKMAAAYLLPRAEAALRQELQRLADALKRAREGRSSSSSVSRPPLSRERFAVAHKPPDVDTAFVTGVAILEATVKDLISRGMDKDAILAVVKTQLG
jgi:hypothetical protein